MNRISKYILKIISILLLWSNAFFIVAGENDESKRTFYGFSVDFDLADPFLSALNPNRFGVNASVQADLLRTVFPVIEVGYATYEGASYYSYLTPEMIEQPPNYRYHVNGTYYKIGVDFNLLSSKDHTKNAIPIGFLGIRYGISPFNYKIENLMVKDFYWNDETYLNAKGSTIGQWAEFVAGVRTPIYKNFCLGVSARFRQFLYIKEKREGDKVVRSSFAPGFGEKENDTWGFRYTISYFFPFTK